jgi:transcriptional regulator with XRE-family HTH domain
MPQKQPNPDDSSNELRQHLIRRHRQNLAGRRGASSAHKAAALGRYVRAARINAGLSLVQLAQISGLAAGTLLALEQGIIVDEDIKPGWVDRLAIALGEETVTLNLLLNRQDTVQVDRWQQVSAVWKTVSARWLPAPVYATLPAILLFTLLSIALFNQLEFPYRATGPQQPVQTLPATVAATVPSSAPPVAFANISAEERLSLLNAERVKILIDEPPSRFQWSSPPSVLIQEPAPVNHSFLTAKLNALFPKPGGESQMIYPPVLFQTPVSSVQLEGRPNVTHAEYRLDNQVLVIPKVINVNSEVRQNMVKAEIKL